MRAVTPRGPKLLRIGVVEQGRLIEERLFERATRITVGATERCTFVMPVQNVALRRPRRVFDVENGELVLNVFEGISGRLLLPNGIVDLDELGRSPHEERSIRLGDDARGKLVFGDRTLLFQFVDTPPVRPKPRLPASLTRGSFIDHRTTLLAGLSFLLHFLAIGALYSDWTDPIVDEQMVVSGVIDALHVAPPAEPETAAPSPDATATRAEPSHASRDSATRGEHRGGNADRRAAETAALSRALGQIEFQTVGALNGMGPSVHDVLGTREVPMTSLDDAAKSDRGIGFDPSGLTLHGGGSVVPGSKDFGTLPGVVAGSTPDSGKRVEIRGPTGSAQPGPAQVQGGKIVDASAVVARLSAGFRRCYERALTDNPDAQGQIALTLAVGDGGEVQSVTAVPNGNLPASVVSCVRQRAAYAHFAPPGGGGAAVTVPVKFVRQ